MVLLFLALNVSQDLLHLAFKLLLVMLLQHVFPVYQLVFLLLLQLLFIGAATVGLNYISPLELKEYSFIAIVEYLLVDVQLLKTLD